ncbi:FAD-dependent thymidylate synthase [Patescibacteria group bacterium]|nr:FAD-dependent thymidylate synthase [Patescibacteria group bacterium]
MSNLTRRFTEEELTPEELHILSRFVSNPNGEVFVVNDRELPGLVGAIYARYSRAAGGFQRTLLKEFVNENGEPKTNKADELIRRVLIAFGDDSVGELEGAHLSIENISNLATKEIEDRRIGLSPIEQSSRYVTYDQKDIHGRWRYLRDNAILNSPVGGQYVATMDEIFATYTDLATKLEEYFRIQHPIEEVEYQIRDGRPKQHLNELTDESEIKDFKRTYKTDVHTRACDTARILLPAATLTNVGLFGNGRGFHNMLNSLYSHPLPEMVRIAEEAHQELNQSIPRYVERAAASAYLMDTRSRMRQLGTELCSIEQLPILPGHRVELLPATDLITSTMAQMLFPYTELSSAQLRELAEGLAPEQRRQLIATYHGQRENRRQRPGRALEDGYPIKFEFQADFGIYRDLHRHRMLTQERQLLSTRLGFVEIPQAFHDIGETAAVERCIQLSRDLYEAMRQALGVDYAQYAVLFGFNLRWTMGMNIREAMHLLELRTIAQGHPSYRRVAQEMHRQLLTRYPELAAEMKFVDYNDYVSARGASEAYQRQREAKLSQ